MCSRHDGPTSDDSVQCCATASGRVGQIGQAQIGAREVNVAKAIPAEVRLGQVGVGEARANAEVESSHIALGKVLAAEVYRGVVRIRRAAGRTGGCDGDGGEEEADGERG